MHAPAATHPPPPTFPRLSSPAAVVPVGATGSIHPSFASHAAAASRFAVATRLLIQEPAPQGPPDEQAAAGAGEALLPPAPTPNYASYLHKICMIVSVLGCAWCALLPCSQVAPPLPAALPPCNPCWHACAGAASPPPSPAHITAIFDLEADAAAAGAYWYHLHWVVSRHGSFRAATRQDQLLASCFPFDRAPEVGCAGLGWEAPLLRGWVGCVYRRWLVVPLTGKQEEDEVSALRSGSTGSQPPRWSAG